MEIKCPLSLTIEEETLIDMHSLLNIMGVITYELMAIGKLMNDPFALGEAIESAANAGDTLRDRTAALRMVSEVDTFIQDLESLLDNEAREHGLEDHPQLHQSRRNLRSIFNIMKVRAVEIAARMEDPLAWVRHDISRLRQNFVDVFQAIERNSHGGYRIVYNIAEHEEGHYFVSFEINSIHSDHIYMPAVFQDVMRDLIANARKYTQPGGRIIAGLAQSDERLRFVVSDDGVGIPPSEIEKMVQFGLRGTNVADRPTRGGGFGLTKAYYVTKLFGGRLWIDSTGIPGEGTRIEIVLPLPGELRQKNEEERSAS